MGQIRMVFSAAVLTVDVYLQQRENKMFYGAVNSMDSFFFHTPICAPFCVCALKIMFPG